MNFIREWTLTICITAVAGSIFSLLIPNSNIQKICKVTLSTFFLCCIIIPLLNIKDNIIIFKFDYGTPSNNIEELNNKIEEQTLYSIEKLLYLKVEKYIFEKTGILPIQIDITINKDDSGEIYISELLVILEKESKGIIEDKLNKISNELGIKPKIVFK